MALLRYITHPQVAVDLGRPVPTWGLSDLGRARVARMLEQPWVESLGRVISSAETKAVQTARTLAAHLQVQPEVRAETGENDRSATGPLPPDEFERVVDRFFTAAHESVLGWERAIDAQSRICRALADLFDPGLIEHARDIAVIGHGGVGTLWYCHLAGLPIDRRYDQPSQGHYFSVDLATRRPVHGFRPIDELP